MVESLGNTRRVPLACMEPIPLSMEMLLASVTFQLKVEDWPRSIEEGSATNRVMLGAAGGGAGAAAGGGGGGGGGGGAFFLHPAANNANIRQTPMVLIFRLSNMNLSLLKGCREFYLAHIGVQFLPVVVNCFNWVPSASIVQICSDPVRVDIKARRLPSGAHVGFSLRPAP